MLEQMQSNTFDPMKEIAVLRAQLYTLEFKYEDSLDKRSVLIDELGKAKKNLEHNDIVIANLITKIEAMAKELSDHELKKREMDHELLLADRKIEWLKAEFADLEAEYKEYKVYISKGQAVYELLKKVDKANAEVKGWMDSIEMIVKDREPRRSQGERNEARKAMIGG